MVSPSTVDYPPTGGRPPATLPPLGDRVATGPAGLLAGLLAGLAVALTSMAEFMPLAGCHTPLSGSSVQMSTIVYSCTLADPAGPLALWLTLSLYKTSS